MIINLKTNKTINCIITISLKINKNIVIIKIIFISINLLSIINFLIKKLTLVKKDLLPIKNHPTNPTLIHLLKLQLTQLELTQILKIKSLVSIV